MPCSGKAFTAKLTAAFAAVYLIWGSTYLAIRYAIETMPPLLMASVRFSAGGLILYAWSRLRGAPRPNAEGWRHAALIGVLLLVFGNGGVVLAEQWVPSGLTAVMISAVPLWVALLGWFRQGGQRPSGEVLAAIVIGMTGVAALIGIGPGGLDAKAVNPTGAVILLFSTLSWAVGSLYAQKVRVSDSPLQTSGMQMIMGGGFLIVAGLLHGEGPQFRPGQMSALSMAALLYLIVFGSIIAFTAYGWLIKSTTPARVTTYAYVNPAVAVALGWLVAGEPLTARTLVSIGMIIAAVMLISLSGRKPVRAN